MVASLGRFADLLQLIDGGRRHVQRFYARMTRGKQYGESRLAYIGAAPTPSEAARRLAAAVVSCPAASSGTRRKWARAVARLNAAAVLFVLLLFGGPTTRADGPQFRLIVTPLTGMVPIGRGIVATAKLVIEDPGPDWYCPAVKFTWADGFSSGHEEDCLPYEQLDEDDRRWFSATKRSPPYGCGEHEIVVDLKQSSRGKRFTQRVIYQGC